MTAQARLEELRELLAKGKQFGRLEFEATTHGDGPTGYGALVGEEVLIDDCDEITVGECVDEPLGHLIVALVNDAEALIECAELASECMLRESNIDGRDGYRISTVTCEEDWFGKLSAALAKLGGKLGGSE